MLKAVIVGAGGIGATYSSPKKNSGILTHAHAYQDCNGVQLSGFYDTNAAKAKGAAKTWKTKAFASLKEMMETSPDIVSVCVPDVSHEEVLREVISYSPKAIFCEKPLTVHLKASQEILALCEKKNILLEVNYTRRNCPEFIQLRNEITNGRFGKSLNTTCIYTKGIRHSGSHAIDLLRFFFGDMKFSQVVAARNDGVSKDPTVDAFLQMRDCPSVHLIGGDARSYSIFEMDLLFEKNRIRIIEAGRKIHYYGVQSHPDYPGFKILKQTKIQNTRLSEALKYSVQKIVGSLQRKRRLQNSAKNALEAQKICDYLIRQSWNLRP